MSDPLRAEDIIGEPRVVRQVLLTYLKHLHCQEWGQCVLTHDAVRMQAYEEKTRRKSWRKLAAQLGVRL